MKLATALADLAADQLKSKFDDAVLKVYSVARPASVDAPVTRSGLLATFKFASPAFDAAAPAALGGAVFAENPIQPEGVGVPGFARAYAADGATPIADFSVGQGDAEIALSEVATTPGFPIAITRFRFGG